MLSEVKAETDNPTLTSVCKTSPQSQLTLREATNLPHNQIQDIHTKECTPPLPNFGWESIPGEKDPIPYVVRDSVSYVAWMIYEKKILMRFTRVLSRRVLAFITSDLEQMSEAEAAMFNEINLNHCDGNLLGQNYRFKSGEPMLSLEDVMKSFDFFLTCFNIVCLTKSTNDLFGFLKISGENEVAFVWNKKVQLVPLFYFEGQSEYLDSRSIDLTNKWQVRYMKFCCMAQGVRGEHYDQSPLKVVDFEYVRRLFPENTSIDFSWPKDFNQDILAPEARLDILRGTTSSLLPVTKSSEPTNQFLTTANTANSKQSYGNSTPQLGGKNQSEIPHPKTRWDQTVNSTQLQLGGMTLGQPINTQTRVLQPEHANPAQSGLNNTTSGLSNNNQSGIKRSITKCNKVTKRFRLQRKMLPMVTETSNQIASSTSVQQPQTSVLYETAGVKVSLIPEKENTVQNSSTTQQKQSVLMSMPVHTESCVVPRYEQKENSSSTTSTSNQTVITSAAHVGHAVKPQNVPLYRTRPALPPLYSSGFEGIRPRTRLPSHQMRPSNFSHCSPRTAVNPEYRFSNSRCNETAPSVYPANMLNPPQSLYPQQNEATCNPTVIRPNNCYGHQNQPLTKSLPISSALYSQLTAYFQQNVPKGSHVNLNALTGMFMNTCGITGPEQARLGSWIYKEFADMCQKAGCFLQIPPLRNTNQDQSNSQVQANSDKIKIVECEHVINGGKYGIKILPLGSQKIYGITLSTVTEKYIVNCADVENKFRVMFKDFKAKLAKIRANTLYKLNGVQKLHWDELVKAGLVCLGPYEYYFIEYHDIIIMLNSIVK